jgi:hypothetical protein
MDFMTFDHAGSSSRVGHRNPQEEGDRLDTWGHFQTGLDDLCLTTRSCNETYNVHREGSCGLYLVSEAL